MFARGTTHDVPFTSAALGEEMRLLVHEPAGFDPDEEHGLLIASDGRDYFQIGRIARVADELVDAGEFDRTIIAGVPYVDRADRNDKYYPAGSKYEAYLHMLTCELPEFLAERFPITADRDKRALAGDSLAGTISLLGVLARPDSFSRAILHSPFVDELVLEAVRRYDGREEVAFYHTIGLLETDVDLTGGRSMDFVGPNRDLHKLFGDVGIGGLYEEKNGDHTWRAWQPDMPQALRSLFRM